MATREVLRRQVQSMETLHSVVQTMKALATVRIGQVRRAVKALDTSAATLELAFQALLRREPGLAAYLLPHDSEAWAAVLFGSDHGLCGPFNERLARHANTRLAPLTERHGPPHLMLVGRRLRSRVRALGYDVERVLTLPGSVDAIDDAVLQIVDQIETWQRDHDVARVLVMHHRPTSGVSYRPRTLQLLPLDFDWLRELRHRAWPTNRLAMLGLDGEQLLRRLVRQQLATLLVRAFAASQAAENAARLAAMEAAERNVDERLTQLRHTANLERQNAVTEELLDVQAAYHATGEARMSPEGGGVDGRASATTDDQAGADRPGRTSAVPSKERRPRRSRDDARSSPTASAPEVAMRLETYRRKRDFSRTPEPRGDDVSKSTDRPRFVIHEHDASTHHFDVRLEVDGVLKSWAVPKGPSTDPREKRLALPTEDHPLEYADFEGVIPEDAYGAGTVLVWDAGRYRNLKEDDDLQSVSVAEQLEDGHATVWLEGEKLRGGYALTRVAEGEDERWLLVKMDDDEADARRNPVSTEPESVKTGRTLADVAEEEGGG